MKKILLDKNEDVAEAIDPDLGRAGHCGGIGGAARVAIGPVGAQFPSVAARDGSGGPAIGDRIGG